jgi:hypothetical protein
MIEQPLEPLHIAIAVAIMAIGSALQASAGIGLALVVVPILALVDHSFIPGPMLLAGVMLALMTAYRKRTAIDVPALRSSLIGLAIGTIVGAFSLKLISGPNLDKTFGGLVLLAVLLSVSGYNFNATPRSLMLAGAAAGVMGAMVGIHGPPISLVFQNTEPRVARAMLGALLLGCLSGCGRCACRARIVRVSAPCPRCNPLAWRRHWSCCRPASCASRRWPAASPDHPRYRCIKRSHACCALARLVP